MLVRRILNLIFIAPILYIFCHIYSYNFHQAVQMLDLGRIRLYLLLFYLMFFAIGISMKISLTKVKCIFKGQSRIDIKLLLFSLIFLVLLMQFFFVWFLRGISVSLFVAFLFGYYLMDSFVIKDNNKVIKE